MRKINERVVKVGTTLVFAPTKYLIENFKNIVWEETHKILTQSIKVNYKRCMNYETLKILSLFTQDKVYKLKKYQQKHWF